MKTDAGCCGQSENMYSQAWQTQASEAPASSADSGEVSETTDADGADFSCGTSCCADNYVGDDGATGATDEASDSNAVGETGTPAMAPTTGPVAAGNGQMPVKTGIRELDQWDNAIAEASRQTGVDPNYIKATIWAESRGESGISSTNPNGVTQDNGLMQISKETYQEVRASQGGPNLDVNDPEQNIIAGAWELKDKIEKAQGDYRAGSMAYYGHGDSTDGDYAQAIDIFYQHIKAGEPPPDILWIGGKLW